LRIEPPGRYGRLQSAMSDHARLRNATVLLLGIGALGNEVAKNLVLLGVGRLLIVDFDHVEESNLSRSLLFRLEDAQNRRLKSDVAAERLREMNPDVDIRSLPLDCTWELGDGVMRHADAIVGAVDGWFPRCVLNRAALRVGKPWIVGGISHDHGWVWELDPKEGGCLECFLPKEIKNRFSPGGCTEEIEGIIEQGGVPTTPMTAAIAAAYQVAAVLRHLGCNPSDPTSRGQGINFNLQDRDLGRFELSRRSARCPAHTPYTKIIEAPLSAERTTLQELFAWLRHNLSYDPVVDITIAGFERVVYLHCLSCHYAEKCGKPTFLGLGAPLCPQCKSALHKVKMSKWSDVALHRTELEPLWDMTLTDCGIPRLHILPVSSLYDRDVRIGVELSDDRAHWFGHECPREVYNGSA